MSRSNPPRSIWARQLSSWGLAVLLVGAFTQAQSPSPDELFALREDFPSAKRAADLWTARAATRPDYEGEWKLARVCYWLGTAGPEKEQKVMLQRGEASGRRAVGIEPAKAEGHFWMAANMGELAERGWFAGIHYKGLVKDELETVLKIDRAWQQGSADRALGEWYFKVPGALGGDDRKAEAHLRSALSYNPKNVATLFFLAQGLADDPKRTAEAITFLQQALDAPLDPEWAPEDRRFKLMAVALMNRLRKR